MFGKSSEVWNPKHQNRVNYFKWRYKLKWRKKSPEHQGLKSTQICSSTLCRNKESSPDEAVLFVSMSTSYRPVMAFADDMIDRWTVFPLASLTCIPHWFVVRLSWIDTRMIDPLLSWGRFPEEAQIIFRNTWNSYVHDKLLNQNCNKILVRDWLSPTRFELSVVFLNENVWSMKFLSRIFS